MIAILVLGLLAPSLLHAEDARPDSLPLEGTHRIATKLTAGAVGGIVGAIIGSAPGLIGEDDCDDPEMYSELCIDDEVAWGFIVGYSIGVPLGVSKADKTDQFLYALAGSLAGFGTAIALTRYNEGMWPSLFVGHIVGATIMSELSRRPPEPRRLSIGLAPSPASRTAVVIANLRF